MVETASNSKRLAKNTFFLYMRTFIVMCITLYSSRVVLNRLGVEDYGIYNIVGGFVSMFSIVSGTLVATTQRFLNFELGKKEGPNLQKIFSAAVTIHILLAAILIILLETIGLWFLNNKLNIPGDRMIAANWVFQCSAITFLIIIIGTPYTALIIAHEKMTAFAFISLIEAFLKLGAVCLLFLSFNDNLVIYAILFVIVSIIVTSINIIYSRKKFEESSFTIERDKAVYKEMMGFAGMNFLGVSASILSNQGVDVLLNLFFGVTINAARGVANQVQSAVLKFVNDFMTALNPQITKEYAAGNFQKSQMLCFRGSRFAFFLMLFFAVPLFWRINYVLDIWLGVYPDFAPIFVRCALIQSLISLLSNALITEILATGKLTSTTLWIGGTRMLTLPLVYIVFLCGFSAEACYVAIFGIEILSLFVRLIILEKITKQKFVAGFFSNVISRIISVSIPVWGISFILNKIIGNGFSGLIGLTVVSIIITIISISTIGVYKQERKVILQFITNKITKK